MTEWLRPLLQFSKKFWESRWFEKIEGKIIPQIGINSLHCWHQPYSEYKIYYSGCVLCWWFIKILQIWQIIYQSIPSLFVQETKNINIWCWKGKAMREKIWVELGLGKDFNRSLWGFHITNWWHRHNTVQYSKDWKTWWKICYQMQTAEQGQTVQGGGGEGGDV